MICLLNDKQPSHIVCVTKKSWKENDVTEQKLQFIPFMISHLKTCSLLAPQFLVMKIVNNAASSGRLSKRDVSSVYCSIKIVKFISFIQISFCKRKYSFFLWNRESQQDVAVFVCFHFVFAGDHRGWNEQISSKRKQKHINRYINSTTHLRMTWIKT